ncbi:MAG: hypothetical protein P4L46_17840 [Fimbriimonas sp.]|nr:hypothetical protein [Fimbriimonas sp.]
MTFRRMAVVYYYCLNSKSIETVGGKLKPVSMRWAGLGLALGVALMVTTDAQAFTPKPKHKPAAAKPKAWTGAENGLVGIKLYDPMLRVLDVYGTPDQIESLSGGGMSLGSGGAQGGMQGGMGMPGGMPGAPGMGRRGNMGMPGGLPGAPGGMGRPGNSPAGYGPPPGYGAPDIGRGKEQMTDSFNLGDMTLMQKAGGLGAPMAPGMSGGGAMGRGAASMPDGAGGMPGGMPGGMGGGIPGGNGGSADRVTFTRWVYNREGSKYGFIIDKSGRVVQIEAIGVDNTRVKTRRGIGFGSNFSNILHTYQQPDGYEIAGDNLTVKYLVHDNVAFRLSRLGAKKPQVVTGIVVAAGKS